MNDEMELELAYLEDLMNSDHVNELEIENKRFKAVLMEVSNLLRVDGQNTKKQALNKILEVLGE